MARPKALDETPVPLGPHNPIFVQFLREVRDKAIARGEIDLAKDIDRHIPDTGWLRRAP